MRLTDIISRERPPRPWAEGDNIPWNEPGFSRRMLKEHLSQDYDAASRRFAIIDDHVAWISSRILGGKPARILDLGCGPGLYANRLAKLGHTCIGIDFSPASVEYAQAGAAAERLTASFTLGDIRATDYPAGNDLVMLIYGELNVFRPAHIRDILGRAHDSLRPGGHLLLEVSTVEGLREDMAQQQSWYSSRGGLFSDRPHLVLKDFHWDEPTATQTIRHYVIDAETGGVEKCAATYQAYSEDQYRELLESAGFEGVQRFAGMGSHFQQGFLVLLARKPE